MRQIVLSQTGAGTSGVAPLDMYGHPFISLQVVVDGTVNYTVQQTLDDPFDSSITPTYFNHPDANLVGATVNRQGNYAFVPAGIRVVVNSGAGSVRFTIIQVGIVG